MFKNRRTARALAAVALALGATAWGAPASAAPGDATVSVLHAVPDTPVDVYVNGDELLTDFEPGTLTDPRSSRPASTTSRWSPPATAPTARR